ncbi:MAG: sodium dependent phosphate transporter [Acidobacteria bacterium]|nr:MAG: sodium dependent phosphate transporter [Acidobacteriota bacterium]
MGDTGAQPEGSSRKPFLAWNETAVRLGLTLFFLYLFLIGVKSLEKGISSFGSDFVDQVFSSVANPIAGLAAGVLATVLVQSSSVTTATIVGLVGAGVLSIETAVPMVMGANIGTTVTNTLASLGHVRQSAYFQRAFAAATVHDYFNLLSVAILLPLEVAFGLISRIANSFANLVGDILPEVGSGSSLIKSAINAPVSWMADTIESLGWSGAEGAILLGVGIGLIFLALWMITRQMKAVMSGRIENAINGVLSKGAGAGALLVGLVMTVAVQSSSITTSILVPLVAAGVLTLRNAFPVTLGANLGTTVTALLASIAADSSDALVIALAHVTFNILGILIFYPWPRMRRIPIMLAERTGEAAVKRKSVVAVYVIGLFIVAPVAILLIT